MVKRQTQKESSVVLFEESFSHSGAWSLVFYREVPGSHPRAVITGLAVYKLALGQVCTGDLPFRLLHQCLVFIPATSG
jgi:hypothetical protein